MRARERCDGRFLYEVCSVSGVSTRYKRTRYSKRSPRTTASQKQALFLFLLWVVGHTHSSPSQVSGQQSKSAGNSRSRRSKHGLALGRKWILSLPIHLSAYVHRRFPIARGWDGTSRQDRAVSPTHINYPPEQNESRSAVLYCVSVRAAA